ncbi:ABC-ATPase domain-containing protein, partial [Pauljensenia hongkongensis]|uniref:ABC-ATPase domain-containing protein n=1 Tax=Pauljensenia hongkongensis TaxID=178339 RepID=UPI0001F65DC4
MSLRTGTDRDLLKELSQMDGRPYGAYRSLAGTWDYGDFTVAIDRVQSDPYAPPSVLRAWTTPSGMGLPDEALASSQARLAAADYLARIFYDAAHARVGRDVQIPRPRQEVLQRSYALVLPDRVEVRFQVRLPARGRTILGRTAARLFDVDVPNIIMDCFDFVTDDEATNTKRRGLLTHIAAYEDYCALRGALDENGWVAFVADGAVLARRSGVSQLPLADAVPFISPAALRASVDLPHAGAVTGLAIPPGITLIAGGGYHGKSTLLSAIARGVYAHIPGDGRELVATTPNAMKIRAADGRSITDVDISPFIGGLPGGADTTAFSTANASGSTSQAAAISEAVELGSPLLLIDEDTSATNLLIRDARMRSLVTHEPITPLVDRARGLAEAGTSLIMVVGGSGDYLDVADRVLLMDEYLCHDATERARAIVAEQPRPLPGDDDGAPVGGTAAPAPDEGGAG